MLWLDEGISIVKKIRLENRGVGPFPAMIVGAMVYEKPTFTLVGAGGYCTHNICKRYGNVRQQ